MGDSRIGTDNRRFFPLIDIIKLLSAFAVIFIHVFEIHDGHPIGNFVLNVFCRQAVPFFFIVSGFGLWNKIQKSENIKKTIIDFVKPILFVYLFWIVVWLPDVISTYNRLYPDSSILYKILLIMRRCLLAGNGAYWYLLIMCEAAVVIAVFRNKEKILICLAIVGRIWCILYDYKIDVPLIKQLNNVAYYIFSWNCNVIMSGIPYMVIRYFLSKYYTQIQEKVKFSNLTFLLAYTVSLIVSSVLYFKTGLNPIISINSSLLFAIAIFAKGFSNISHSVALICRNISSSFYISHSIVLYPVIDKIFGIYYPLQLRYLFVVAGCFIIYFITRVYPINKISFLKKVFLMK